MPRQSLTVHLTRTVRYGGRVVVLDARASIRYTSDAPPAKMLEMLRAQCRDELDEQQRLEDRRRGRGLEQPEDRTGRGARPHVRTPPGR